MRILFINKVNRGVLSQLVSRILRSYKLNSNDFKSRELRVNEFSVHWNLGIKAISTKNLLKRRDILV